MSKLKIPLEVVIPMDAIVMLPRGDHYEADLELRVSVLDEQGNRNEMPMIPVALSGPQPPPGSHAVYETTLRVRRQKHDIVVSLYDPMTDTILAASTTVGYEAFGMPRLSAWTIGLHNVHSWALLVVVLLAISTGWGRRSEPGES